MTRLCQWYKGRPEGFFQENRLGRNPSWADYQVLGPTFGAVSMLLSTRDILPVFVNSRGCAYHTRFTKHAWGADFGLVRKALPILEFFPTQVVNGEYLARREQVNALRRIAENKGSNLIVILCSENALLSGDSLDDLSAQIETGIGIPTLVLRVSGISGANPWVAYDRSLGVIYEHVWDTPVEERDRQGVNLFGWKWSSRERDHDVGICLKLLEQLGVRVNHVLPGGASLADFSASLRSRINILWCSSYIGPTLERLEQEKGLRIAGRQTPYGFEGTLQWIRELAEALEDEDVLARGTQLAEDRQGDLRELKRQLKGKRAFVSGGPGRLMGLLHMMADLEIDVVAVSLYWIHADSREKLKSVLARFPKQPEILITSPSLYELDEVAEFLRPDVWLGGYQELHTCKKFTIPFVPTTLYVKSHQAFEGCIHLGHKMIEALDGRDFVANPYVTAEMQC